MKRVAHGILLSLTLCLLLVGCQTSGTSSSKKVAAPAKPQTAAELEQSLGEKMLLLKDGRDMRLVVVRVSSLGVDEAAVQNAARGLTFADYRAYLEFAAKVHRVRYVGSGQFLVEALDYTLGQETFGEASFLFQASRFKAEGVLVDGVILERVLLNGRDLTTFVSVKLYERLLKGKVGL